MSCRSDRRRTYAVLFAVLGGFFLLHGVSTHAAAHAVEPTAEAGHAGHHGPEDGGGGALELAELCLTALAGGLLLALGRRTSWLAEAARDERLRFRAGPSRGGRSLDPPDLVRLSVCRT